VKKNGGIDDGTLYAMKAIAFSDVMKLTNGREQCETERYVHERGSESPFLVGLNYTIVTPTQMFLLSTTVPDSMMFEKRSEQHNDKKGRSVEWERAVTETGHTHTHSTFIILSTLQQGICLCIGP
jgi:hypothetical protein